MALHCLGWMTSNPPDKAELMRRSLEILEGFAEFGSRTWADDEFGIYGGLFFSRTGLAEAFSRQGRVEEAVELYEKQLEIFDMYMQRYPGDLHVKAHQFGVRQSLGLIYEANGELDKARKLYYDNFKERKEWFAAMPAIPWNERSAAEFVDSMSDLVRLSRNLGEDCDEAALNKACLDVLRPFDRNAGKWSYFYKRRALLYFKSKDYDNALADVKRAFELRPGDLSCLTWIRPTLVAKCPDRDFRSKVFELTDRAVEMNKRAASAREARAILRASAHENRARLYAATGQTLKAIEDLNAAVELNPASLYPQYLLALLRLSEGETAAYRTVCATMVNRFRDTKNTREGTIVAWTCALSADAVDDYSPVLKLAEQAEPNGSTWQHLGGVLLRAGQLNPAVDALKKADQLTKPSKIYAAYTWCFLAMAYHKQDNAAEARRWIEKAETHIDEVLAEDSARQADALDWKECLELTLLRDEARALLQAPAEPLESAEE